MAGWNVSRASPASDEIDVVLQRLPEGMVPGQKKKNAKALTFER